MQLDPNLLTRAEGLTRLAEFVPRAGRAYATTRNTDPGPDALGGVSGLSPWLKRRVLSEREVVDAVLDAHAPSSCEKFVQEVFWRSYFKGWLEHRPQVWGSYQTGLAADRDASGADPDLARALAGETGIDAFDAWVRELRATGHLHNHARMWFASIWIFTLRLPWRLGADFFLSELLDGDAASNTLSWRWALM